MREKIDKIINSKFGNCVERFFGSVLYILLVGVVSIICHAFDLVMVGTFLWAVLLIFLFIFCKNMFALTPFACMITFIISQNTIVHYGYFNTTSRMFALIVEFVLVFSSLVFNFTYYKRWKLLFKKAYLTVSLCFVTAVLLIGGLGAESYSVSGVLIGIGIAASMFLPYSLFINCGVYEGTKTVRYFAWTTVIATVVIGAAVLQVYRFITPDFFEYPKKYLQFGYAGPNTGAAFVVIALPMTFYLIYSYRHGYLLLPFAFLEVILVVALFSRASLVVIIPLLLVLIIVVGIMRKTLRWAYCVVSGLIAVAAIIVITVKWSFVYDSFAKLSTFNGFDGGRFDLWKLGFEGWKNTPIFGAGIRYMLNNGSAYYSFHNTPLTYLFCCGIAGLAAYLYHRYKTVRLVFTNKPTVERVFVAISILGMLINALLDIGMTYPQLLLYYAVMLAIIEHDVRYTKDKGVSIQATAETEGENNE